MSSAAGRCRKQFSFAGSVQVFITTSPFMPDAPFYSNAMTIALPSPTQDTRMLVNAALWGLKQIYRPNYQYVKAGVMLSELVPMEGVQTDLFSQVAASPKSNALMTVSYTHLVVSFFKFSNLAGRNPLTGVATVPSGGGGVSELNIR